MINKIKFSILFLILILLSCKSESKPTREDDIDTSVYDMWNAFKASNPEFKNENLPDSDFFHDNEVDANRLAKLIVNREKKASSSLYNWYKAANANLPQIGTKLIVTDFNGKAQAIIKTTKVDTIPFDKITADYAELDMGTNNKPLEKWKEAHWTFFSNTMKQNNRTPAKDMLVVCEWFETIWPKKDSAINLLTDINPVAANGDINAIIEIPAGTVDKWELNKTTGNIEWEIVDNSTRRVNYIGYPGNYGMIPKTLLPKNKGGDGDPLDILVLGPPAERNEILKCKIIGILYLSDRGEQDDKLIAVSSNSSLYAINTIEELNTNYLGVSEIVKLWFVNYKGPGQLESNGFGNKDAALKVLNDAITYYSE
ncbi:inorganic diphosphatase [Winogradskyella wichelsiae]|uniref:inorganic diphosphatase n=1 Tax=Winogradskyella wichelsiae TaxID=2697007 RepID=UPI003EF9E84A